VDGQVKRVLWRVKTLDRYEMFRLGKNEPCRRGRKKRYCAEGRRSGWAKRGKDVGRGGGVRGSTIKCVSLGAVDRKRL